MNAAVTINFAGGTASTGFVQVLLEHAGFALEANEGVAANIHSGFTNIAIEPGSLSVATAAGGAFDGMLTLVLQWSGQDPAVTLNNLVPAAGAEPATITWPTADGPQVQILTPGAPLTLTGIAGD